jgi:hypothetical protein
VLVSDLGHVCTSPDNGETWTRVELGEMLTSDPIWTGTAFMVWSPGRVFQSADGSSWDSAPIVPGDLTVGAVARGPEGALVTASGSYEQQRFAHSTDGTNWEVLDAGSFLPSHQINFIQFGYVNPGAGCPAP